ncbi:MAG: glycosyltransferase [Bacilli bacterium]|nr:glycosyltransferase [Bacilli bacterium]
MKICFTLSSLSAGGAERVASSLANQFVSMGHDVSIILVSIDYNNTFYDINEKIKVIPLLKSKKDKRSIRRIKLLRKCVLNIKPDIVIAFLPHICIYSFFALRNTKIPLICSERNDPNQYNFIYKKLLKYTFRRCDGCVFQTSQAKNFYNKVSENKATIIFNPVSLCLTGKTVRNKEKDKLFISVGRLTPQKNFSLLINAFYDFYNNHRDYKLIIFGEGPLRSELEKQISLLGLSESVLLPGTNQNWHDVAYNASGFISSSNYEGMPNSLEEALCLGCPSIATNCPVGGSRELISLLSFGKLIEPNNKEQMVAEMNRLIMENNNEQNVDYSALMIDSISKQWICFIEKILAN